jgi:hypothetical protein
MGPLCNQTYIRFESDFRPAGEFRTGVSLHSHTLHSRETVDNIRHMANQVPPLRWALNRGAAWYRAHHGVPFELSRLWWTPPLSAHQAWTVETRQIREHFGMQSLVSLSDHDDMEAAMILQHREECVPLPISVEWTVPYSPTYFHIGVHNIPAERARAVMADFASLTAGTPRTSLRQILRDLNSYRDTLIVFNHANWDESGVGDEAHLDAVRRFTAEYQPYLHAFELNGTRSWAQNRAIFDLARHFGKPLMGGGDRHGREPNTILNLTNSTTMSEFVAEIRDGYSEVLITDQYLEPRCMRILQSLEDVLGQQEDHVYGWKRWCDRAFYRCDDGVVRSLDQAWGENPAAVRWLGRAIGFLWHPRFRSAFRIALARREEVVL